MATTTVTAEMLKQGRSKTGGWSAEQFALLGIIWPPEKGWKSWAIGRRISSEAAKKFVELKGASKQQKKKEKRRCEPQISREELAAWHAEVRAQKPRPGDENYSLLCSLGAGLGNWPRVKRKRVDELRSRVERMRTDCMPVFG